ncbi:hypothetical protein ACJ73_00912 [Blastomyces percursus]|uniref:Uncharacterized protein n=1 Tax=Blastomyces percursus TaxID=1658174 RepID=A0A1J9QFV0_9EURO|nr:hypothetical protein ACJ73_00912 [Blastomyces percursus]
MSRQYEFNLAKALIDDPPSALEKISVLEDELRKVDMPIELMNLLHFMLIVNSDERPSAVHVLASKEFLDLEKAVANRYKGLRQIYQAVILSQMTYAASTWYALLEQEASYRKKLVLKLEAIQQRAAKTITGALRHPQYQH